MSQLLDKGLLFLPEKDAIRKAVKILCCCRRTLAFSYVFAYYLKKNNQCYILEENQRDLEMATESLSEYLEHDLNGENFQANDVKIKVINQSQYCQNRYGRMARGRH
jgi:ariadne-1